MKIVIVNQTAMKLPEAQMSRFVKSVILELRKKRLRSSERLRLKKELTLVFLTSNQIKKINQQYRGKNKATDVLSFIPFDVDNLRGENYRGDKDSLGELLFCIDVLKKQAKEQKHSFAEEFAYMLIHGLLHLLGYDHEVSKKEEKIMFSLQDRIFEQLFT